MIVSRPAPGIEVFFSAPPPPMNHCSLGVGREQLWRRDGGGEFLLVFSSTGWRHIPAIHPVNLNNIEMCCRHLKYCFIALGFIIQYLLILNLVGRLYGI